MTFRYTLHSKSNYTRFLYNQVLNKMTFLGSGLLLFLILNACSKSPDLSDASGLKLEIWSQGKPIVCSQFVRDQQKWQQTWDIQQLAFFISDIHVVNESNSQNIALLPSHWQTSEVVLIQPNLTDCAEQPVTEQDVKAGFQSGPEILDHNTNIIFNAPVDLEGAQTLAFSLGVPFDDNHQNPLTQPSPLNLPSMFWSWRSGHKFFRVDLVDKKHNWVFHLGSVGCIAASAMRSPQTECVQPNRFDFELSKKQDGSRLILHLDKLLAGMSLQDSKSCLFHGEQQNCDVLMANLANNAVFEWQ